MASLHVIRLTLSISAFLVLWNLNLSVCHHYFCFWFWPAHRAYGLKDHQVRLRAGLFTHTHTHIHTHAHTHTHTHTHTHIHTHTHTHTPHHTHTRPHALTHTQSITASHHKYCNRFTYILVYLLVVRTVLLLFLWLLKLKLPFNILRTEGSIAVKHFSEWDHV